MSSEQMDEVEFWLDNRVVLSVNSSHAPAVGDLVSIRGETYRVSSRNFSVDYADNVRERRMRLAVNITRSAAQLAKGAEK